MYSNSLMVFCISVFSLLGFILFKDSLQRYLACLRYELFRGRISLRLVLFKHLALLSEMNTDHFLVL